MFGRFFVGWGYCRVSLVGLLSHVFPQVRGVSFAGKISSKSLQISRINILQNQL
jgi:hypothetical protein